MWLVRCRAWIQSVDVLMSKSASLILGYYSHLPHLCAASLPLFHLPRIAFLFIPNCQGLTQGLLQMPIPFEIFPDFALPE